MNCFGDAPYPPVPTALRRIQHCASGSVATGWLLLKVQYTVKIAHTQRIIKCCQQPRPQLLGALMTKLFEGRHKVRSATQHDAKKWPNMTSHLHLIKSKHCELSIRRKNQFCYALFFLLFNVKTMSVAFLIFNLGTSRRFQT